MEHGLRTHIGLGFPLGTPHEEKVVPTLGSVLYRGPFLLFLSLLPGGFVSLGYTLGDTRLVLEAPISQFGAN